MLEITRHINKPNSNEFIPATIKNDKCCLKETDETNYFLGTSDGTKVLNQLISY